MKRGREGGSGEALAPASTKPCFKDAHCFSFGLHSFFSFPQRAAVIYSHQTGLLPCTSPAHVSLQPPHPQRMKTTWPQGLAPLDPCRQLVNPANSSPSQQKTLGTDENQQVGRELCWCPQPLVGSSPSCSWQWFSWWQARPGRDKLGCSFP